MPARRLSTYIPQSNGWSKPVWNLLATSSTWYSPPLKASATSRPFNAGFSVALLSVKASGPDASSSTSPLNATSVPMP